MDIAQFIRDSEKNVLIKLLEDSPRLSPGVCRWGWKGQYNCLDYDSTSAFLDMWRRLTDKDLSDRVASYIVDRVNHCLHFIEKSFDQYGKPPGEAVGHEPFSMWDSDILRHTGAAGIFNAARDQPYKSCLTIWRLPITQVFGHGIQNPF